MAQTVPANTPTLKSHMVIPSCREIRFVVCFPGDPAEGEPQPYDVPGIISYDRFRHEPYGPKAAAEVFARNHGPILAAAAIALRRARKNPPTTLVLSVGAEEMAGALLD